MKRSEMVSELIGLMYEHLSGYPDCSIDTTNADKVLDGLVKAGMLPPTILDTSSWDCFANRWEEEK